MKQIKAKWIRRGVAAALAILLLVGIVLDISVFATEGENTEHIPTATSNIPGENARGEAETPTSGENSASDQPKPTFAVDEDDDNSIRIKVGNNSLLFGNDFATRDNIKGLAFIAGNTITVDNSAKYGFVAGNTVKISGAIQNDLFVTGNLLNITETANIGGDVFAAGNEMVVQTDLPGDLAFTGSTLKIEGTTIRGNVNLSVDKVVFDANTKIEGSLTYNDTATIVGLGNASIKNVESYHIDEEEPSLAREFYAKFLSMVGLFIVMLVLIFLMPRLHHEVARTDNTQGIIVRMATGAWLLILIPILAIFALCSVVGVPLGLILIALYVIAIYVSQGFAGVWVGHLVIEKLAKSRANVYIEALVGIILLGVLSMLPYIGGLIYFLSLLLGFGTLAHYFKPNKFVEVDSGDGKNGKLLAEKPFTKSSTQSSSKSVGKLSDKSATKSSAKTPIKPDSKKSQAKSSDENNSQTN